ncbi:Uncharacterized protein C8034_v009981 [Colletotrichum sidae]|uniref:Eisosome protein 1 n=1 Tax=Colletotrichum sidae TaxID=1347389 RepID=A0A4R8TL90_9PEZI|nr:Uncharacterized protein C8034_v009981 [Colletotrichum sidae]
MAERRYHTPITDGHSGKLKYADPRDLPSYPSPGLKSDGAAAGAAASLGWTNQKPIDIWKPEKSNSASTAALLAKDYKMATSWEPNSSSAGAKAALMASASARKQATIQPTTPVRTPHESWGNSAANQAFKKSLSVRQPPQSSSAGGLGSLTAAQNAMTPRRSRQRAKSTPAPKESYPGEFRAVANALSAATAAHGGPSLKPKSPTSITGAVPYTTMPRKMFTASPSIGPEAEDQKRADVLHASAVAMAKKMYTHQQKMVDQARQARQDSGYTSPEDDQPRPYVNLQEAAYKLAQERLSKLHEEHQRNQDYQQYYGSDSATQPQRRFTMKGKLRKGVPSDGEYDDDKERSERIRKQMSIFSSNISKVDEQQRTKDREALLAAAQRNVRSRLQDMDDKISAETGMKSPTKPSDWEAKAHAAAQAKYDFPNDNKGKIDIGGGMYMDPAAVDEIAARRVQPLLDDINEKASLERERQELIKAEAEAKKADEEKKKERDREIKEINRKLKEADRQEEKERRHREKQDLKAQKEEEKAAKSQEKRSSGEKGKAKLPDLAPGGITEEVADHAEGSTHNEPIAARRGSQHHPTIDTQQETSAVNENPKSPSESGSPTHKMKEWLKSRFSRPRGRSSAGDTPPEERGFVGGVALTRLANESATSLDGRSASMREIAIAGKSGNKSEGDSPRSPMARQDFGVRGKDSKDVNPVTSDDESEQFVEASDDLSRGPLSPPPPIREPYTQHSGSPTRDSRFREMME